MILFKIDACLHFFALIKKKTNTCFKMEDNWSVVFGQFRLPKDPRLAGWLSGSEMQCDSQS